MSEPLYYCPICGGWSKFVTFPNLCIYCGAQVIKKEGDKNGST